MIMQRVVRCLILCKPNLVKNVAVTCQLSTDVTNSESSTTSSVKPVYQSVTDFYGGKSVFLTGATGFLGRLLIERLLFTCKDIDNLYVLIREKENVNIHQRLQQLLDNPIFTKLKQTRPQDLSKVIPISGDISKPQLGLSSDDEQTLIEKVSVIFHSAANVNFVAHTSEHIRDNYEGTKKVMELGKKIKNLDIFVHVSTAFDNSKTVIDEIPYPPPKKIEEIYQVLKDHGNNPRKIRELLLDTQGNSYIMSKKMGESLLASDRGNMPAIVVRPAMVTSIYKDPLIGYSDSWVICTGVLCDIASGITRVLYGNKRSVIDIIPADYVCNFLIIAAAKNSRTKECNVYNIGTSHANPIVIDRMIELFLKEAKYHDYAVLPFPTVMWTYSSWALPMFLFFLQTLPGFVLDTWLLMTGRKPRFMKLEKRAILRIKLAYPVTVISWTFKTARARRLISTLDAKDKETFPCDPADIDWEKYVPIYTKGVKKYMLQDKNRE